MAGACKHLGPDAVNFTWTKCPAPCGIQHARCVTCGEIVGKCLNEKPSEPDDLHKAAAWLVDMDRDGLIYAIDFQFGSAPPPAFREAIIDELHRDPTGRIHGNQLARWEVELWIESEAPELGRPE
jgi:hypothetical protein